MGDINKTHPSNDHLSTTIASKKTGSLSFHGDNHKLSQTKSQAPKRFNIYTFIKSNHFQYFLTLFKSSSTQVSDLTKEITNLQDPSGLDADAFNFGTQSNVTAVVALADQTSEIEHTSKDYKQLKSLLNKKHLNIGEQLFILKCYKKYFVGSTEASKEYKKLALAYKDAYALQDENTRWETRYADDFISKNSFKEMNKNLIETVENSGGFAKMPKEDILSVSQELFSAKNLDPKYKEHFAKTYEALELLYSNAGPDKFFVFGGVDTRKETLKSKVFSKVFLEASKGLDYDFQLVDNENIYDILMGDKSFFEQSFVHLSKDELGDLHDQIEKQRNKFFEDILRDGGYEAPDETIG